MNDDICTMFQGLATYGGKKRIINHKQQVVVPAYSSDARQINGFHQRIGHQFEENNLCIFVNLVSDGIQVKRVHIRHSPAKLMHIGSQQVIAATVKVIGGNNMTIF